MRSEDRLNGKDLDLTIQSFLHLRLFVGSKEVLELLICHCSEA